MFYNSKQPMQSDNSLVEFSEELQQLAKSYRLIPEKLRCLKILYKEIYDKLVNDVTPTDDATTDIPKMSADGINSLKLFLDKNYKAYILSDNKLDITVSLILLANSNPDFFKFLSSVSQEDRLILINGITDDCIDAGYRFNELSPDLQFKLAHSFNFLMQNEIDDIIFVVSNDSFVFYAKSPRKTIEDPLYGLIGNVNEIKLHVTMPYNYFYKHQDNLTRILLEHTLNDTIPEFKFIFTPALGIGDDLDLFLNQKNMKVEDVENRYIIGDQITIYLPQTNDPTFDLEKIAELCKVINEYCESNAIPAGTYTKLESALTPNINLRQDRFNGEYVPATSTDRQLIEKMKGIQKNSDIYQFLHMQLNTSQAKYKNS